MVTDRDRVYALLRSLLDWVPGPRTGTGSLVERSAKRGVVPTRRVECQRCKGRGRVSSGRAETVCEACAGAGRVKVDPYDRWAGVEPPPPTARIATREAWAKRHDLTRRRDAEIDRLERDAKRRGLRADEVDPDEREPWEPARDRLYAAGSYQELERALQQLREHAPYHHEIVWLYAVCGLEDTVTLGPRARGKIDGIVDRLVVWMPAMIRVPPWLEGDDEEGLRKHALWHGRSNGHDERRLRRNRLIRDLDADGVTVTEISRRTGLGRQHVHELLAGDAHYQAGGTAA